MTLTLTDALVDRVRKLRESEGKQALMLRVAVDGGGCQGFEYRFELTEAQGGDDIAFDKGGVRVVVDSVSLPYLNGAEIDFADELVGASFKVNNPNAKSSCGCGTSFSV